VDQIERRPEHRSLGKRFRHSRPIRWLRKFAPREPFAFEKQRLYWQIIPYTMCSYERLSNVYDLASEIERVGTAGAFVECGVFRGGCAALMAHVADRGGSGRKTWLFDSFEGLPEPTEKDGDEAREFAGERSSGTLSTIDRCVGPLEAVREILFDKLELNEERIVIRPGWFQDSLPTARDEIGPVSILRLDGDWYESTLCCLVNLYDNVVPGGYVILDDFNRWEGCKKATEDFLAERKITVKLNAIDDAGVYFVKP